MLIFVDAFKFIQVIENSESILNIGSVFCTKYVKMYFDSENTYAYFDVNWGMFVGWKAH